MAALDRLDWDSKHFGISAGRLKFTGGERPAPIRSMLQKSEFEFVISRVPSNDIGSASVLERSGFTLADVRLFLDIDLSEFNRPAPLCNLQMVDYESRYLRKMREIARTSFWSGHFRDDHRFEKAKVSEMYALWVNRCVSENYFIKVAQDKGRAVGFVTAMERDGIFSIELVAVDRRFRGRGVGHDIVSVSLDEAKAQFKRGEVGVHLTNFAAIRLYEKIGFRLADSELTYHWWRR